MRLKSFILLSFCFSSVAAQNPIIRDQYTADPTARVFNGKVYLYPSHDILPPEGQRKDWFCMADYHVFSSENLTDWTDHGIIVSQEQVPWGKEDGYSMWAPDCVEKDGTYYFYFPNGPKSGRGFAVGVATAPQPDGPFTVEQEPIKGVVGIDPCVLIDDDGQAYIYWSGMGLRGARLKENMLQLADPLQEVKMPRREETPEMPPMMVGGEEMKGLPEGFKEGPFAFKRNGWYYLTFPWVRGEKGEGKNPTETLAYAMSRSPLGPWDFKGIIMAEHENHCWTNHHSLVEYKGQWYLFYHHNFFSPGDDKRRSVCIDKVAFNADGTIQEVKPTMRGVGINNATERIEIDRCSEAGPTVGEASKLCSPVVGEASKLCSPAVGEASKLCSPVVGEASKLHDDAASKLHDAFKGNYITLLSKGWLRYAGVDFSTATDAYLVVSASAPDNTEFFIREKTAKGKVIAKVTMTVKSELTRPGMPAPFRRDQSNQWLTMTVPLEYTPKGTVDLVVTNEGTAPVSLDWLQFKNRPKYFSPVQYGATESHPDDQGFIRRWKLMEPIAVDVRSNVIFTNTWLRQKFDEEQARLSKQKKAKWYALDSENYNVKLFRFAEKYGKQTYGLFFWCETVIDCPEEMQDVRLAAGSNGASMWWLNGEEVLLLEGDRRMVEDDGMSARLTLKKGQNTLRCAVINGPGLSDLCARFVDEQGRPVKDFKVMVSK